MQVGWAETRAGIERRVAALTTFWLARWPVDAGPMPPIDVPEIGRRYVVAANVGAGSSVCFRAGLERIDDYGEDGSSLGPDYWFDNGVSIIGHPVFVPAGYGTEIDVGWTMEVLGDDDQALAQPLAAVAHILHSEGNGVG